MTTRMKTPGELVRAFPFFAGLDDARYEEILAIGVTQQYRKDQVLFLDGDPCRGLFLVQAGMIKIYKLNEAGREQILAVQRPGDAVAEVPLFDGGPYPAHAAAMEDSTVLFIPKDAFNALLDRRPQISRSIIAALARRLRTLVRLVEDLSLRQVRQRLARLLLEEAAGRPAFQLPFTNEELAARLGSVRDVISRTLSSLVNDDLITVKGRFIEINDVEALTEEAG